MKPSQEKALRQIKHTVKDLTSSSEQFPVVVAYEIEPLGDGKSYLVHVKPDIPTLPEANLLRVLTRMDDWLIVIRAHGQIVVQSCPDSCRQFAGKRAFGFNFHTSLREVAT